MIDPADEPPAAVDLYACAKILAIAAGLVLGYVLLGLCG